MKRKLSIITVCYNEQNNISQTLDSVLKQKTNKLHLIEQIIVDGASKDNTMNIINSYALKYESKGIHLKVISEKDNGIYSAMNKGLDNCNGEWVQYLNGGDYLHGSTILDEMINELENEKDNSIIHGNVILTKDHKTGYLKKPHRLDVLKQGIMGINHLCMFIKKEVIDKYRFKEEYKIASDYDLTLNLYLDGYKFRHVDKIMAVFDMNGISSTNHKLSYIEVKDILKRNNLDTTKLDHSYKHSLFKQKKYKIYKFIPFLMILKKNLKKKPDNKYDLCQER